MVSSDDDSGTSPSRGAKAADNGHDQSIAQPHDPPDEGIIAEAEGVAAEISTEDQPMGELGRPFDRRSPFLVGMAAAAGVAVTYGLIQLLIVSAHVLLLLGLSLFLAIGLEPATSWLVNHRWPRWAAVTAILLGILGVVGGFLSAAIPALVQQGTQLAKMAPEYLESLQDRSSFLGQLNDRFGLVDKIQGFLDSGYTSLFSGLLTVGQAVFSALADTLIVLVLTAYLLADLPRIRTVIYRLVPHSRRPRAILIGDTILSKIGNYVLGYLIISLIAGTLTYVWLVIFDVPYAFLLAVMVALLDLIPVAGSIIGGAVVSLVALTVSLPVFLATVAFFVVYRLLEDYLLIPKIIGRAVAVPAVVTIVAILLGGAFLGIVGAVVAIPVAAAVLLLAHEVVVPRLDRI